MVPDLIMPSFYWLAPIAMIGAAVPVLIVMIEWCMKGCE
jgi:hypothetical protein